MHKKIITIFIIICLITITINSVTNNLVVANEEVEEEIYINLDTEAAFFQSNTYEYSIKLLLIDPCDISISETMCIPSLTVMIYQKNIITNEINDDTIIAHISVFRGRYNLDIVYDDIIVTAIRPQYSSILDMDAIIKIYFHLPTMENYFCLPASIRPISQTRLATVLSDWNYLSGCLPEKPTGEMVALIAQIQGHVANAAQLTNPIYASGQLSKAAAAMQQLAALLPHR